MNDQLRQKRRRQGQIGVAIALMAGALLSPSNSAVLVVLLLVAGVMFFLVERHRLAR
jgi:hypothetical protein